MAYLRPTGKPRATAAGVTFLPAFLVTAMLTLVAISPVAQSQSVSPASNYVTHCAGCHHLDGSGYPPEVPDLRSELAYLMGSPAGRDFMLRVPGVTGVPISTAEVTELLNWMIDRFYPDRSDLVAFEVEEVEQGRANPLYDPLRARRELLAGLSDETDGNDNEDTVQD